MTTQREKQDSGLSADIFPRRVPRFISNILSCCKNNCRVSRGKTTPPHHNSEQPVSDRADMGQQKKIKMFKFAGPMRDQPTCLCGSWNGRKWSHYSSLQVCQGFSFWKENKLVTAGEAGNISVQLRYSCVYGSTYIHIPHWYYPLVPCAGFLIARSSLAFHLVVVKAISLLTERLKN